MLAQTGDLQQDKSATFRFWRAGCHRAKVRVQAGLCSFCRGESFLPQRVATAQIPCSRPHLHRHLQSWQHWAESSSSGLLMGSLFSSRIPLSRVLGVLSAPPGQSRLFSLSPGQRISHLNSPSPQNLPRSQVPGLGHRHLWWGLLFCLPHRLSQDPHHPSLKAPCSFHS